MTTEELIEKLNYIQKIKCETQTIELKSANQGCPKRLYDTLSSFSNQDEGGIIFFGIDEKQGYKEVGVYDVQDIQKKINEQCLQMEPVVRPLLTVAEKNGKFFVTAEIPGLDLTERPCYYQGRGRDVYKRQVYLRNKLLLDFHNSRNMHGSRKGVVGTLGHIDMVVGMKQFFLRQFIASVGNHFIYIHIRLGSAAGLPDGQRKVLIQAAGTDFITDRRDKLHPVRVQFSKLVIGNCSGFF